MDNREYRKTVEEFGPMVYRIALNQTRSTADAEDITQAVFLKLFTKAPDDIAAPGADHASGRERLKRWLIRVTVNECRSLWRSAWRRCTVLQDVTDESMAPAFSQPDHEALYHALALLPEKCRIVVHLFYFEGYRTAEIAQILSVREPTVRTRLTRARKLLRQSLKEAWTDEQPKPVQSHDGGHPCSC